MFSKALAVLLCLSVCWTSEARANDGTSNAETIVQIAYDYLTTGDVDDFLTLLSEDFVWECRGPSDFPATGVYHGPNGFQQYLNAFGSAQLNQSSFVVSNQTNWGLNGNTSVMAFGESRGTYLHTQHTAGSMWRMPWSHWWNVDTQLGLIQHVIQILVILPVGGPIALTGPRQTEREQGNSDSLGPSPPVAQAIAAVAKFYGFLNSGNALGLMASVASDFTWTVDCPVEVTGAGGVFHGALGLLKYMTAFATSPYELKNNAVWPSDEWLTYTDPTSQMVVVMAMLDSSGPVRKTANQTWLAPTANVWQVTGAGVIHSGYDLWTVQLSP